jgi:hypothetical protein
MRVEGGMSGGGVGVGGWGGGRLGGMWQMCVDVHTATASMTCFMFQIRVLDLGSSVYHDHQRHVGIMLPNMFLSCSEHNAHTSPKAP